MKKINLNEYNYDRDIEIEVTEEIYNQLEEFRKTERARQEKINYHKAYYEYKEDLVNSNNLVESPEEILIEKETNHAIKKTIKKGMEQLTSRQKIYIKKYFYIGKTQEEIASEKEVSQGAVASTIKRGLEKIKKLLQKI